MSGGEKELNGGWEGVGFYQLRIRTDHQLLIHASSQRATFAITRLEENKSNMVVSLSPES